MTNGNADADRPDPERRPGGSDATSIHILQAGKGDAASLAWVVARFSPLLLAQASYRLARGLRRFYDPEDLVADVWAIALPHLKTSDRWQDRATQSLLRFLSTTLIYRVNNLMRKHFRGERHVRQSDAGDASEDLLAALPAETTGVITRVVQKEHHGQVLACLDEMDPLDRQVIILRGIEQNANETVAALLDMKPNTVSHRYRRALTKLKDRVRDSVFTELPAD